MNILMVDDHPGNLLALEAVLNPSDYNLVSASSGEEALKCVLKQDFAVILLDVQMPGLNGFETAKLIKAREKSKYISIIFITAINQTTEHVLQGYSLGAVDYIFKPFHPETLKLKVQEFVKIYQNHEKTKRQSELQRQFELKEVNKKLESTTFDLRKNEALARVIGETLLETIITFDDQGYTLSVNPAVKDMFGYSIEEVRGQHIGNLLPEVKYGNSESTPLQMDSIRESTGQLFEAVAKHKNGGFFPVDIQIGEAIIEDEYIFVCSVRDITIRKNLEQEKKQQYSLLEKLVEERTQKLSLANEKLRKEIEERKKVEEDLRLSKEHFYKIFESSPCLIEIRSLKDGRYINVNPSWLSYTGYRYEEVVNQNTSVLRIRANPNQAKKESYSLETTERIRNAKIQYETKFGDVHEGLLSTEIFDIHGESCVLSVITDVTENARLESEMARLDRLNLIGEMAAGIAHEIRNPMTTVKGFLQLSKSDPEPFNIEYVDLMLGELNRANSIITEFLNLAKNKVSYKTLQYLNPIIEGLYPLIQAEALLSNKSIALQLGECPKTFLDEKEISQLILNLSLNGLEAMAAGGQLIVKTYTENETVVLEIQDQGCGIKPEILEAIGTPFFTTKETGTGLGLAICYSIAERHNAVIDLKTSEQGTVFFIRFNEIENIKL
ncbi:hybrid sensor histidine kinase/response regulator [Domibacillus aminovorans]|uniref:histidine kinase n=1 Tax=Domibacillus aminovorans TaxID=29332 RepID=A0A177L2W5_9BACI|nr:hybrid sensor histidine kinase/response regulator [Domibacillus aminovorans]